MSHCAASMNIHRATRLIRTYSLLLYWLVFVYIASNAAHDPGFVRYPKSASYPWGGLCFTVILLGVGCAILNAILQPASERTSWRRLGIALLFALGISTICMLTMVTDMPGLYYVPTYFSFSTLLILSLYALARGCVSGWEWLGSSRH